MFLIRFIRLPSAFFSFVMFLMLIFLGLGMAPVFTDPDTAWHLAAGDLIRAQGLPLHDGWSFTAGDQLWYNLSWLFDTALSFLCTAGGLTAIYTLTLVVFASCAAFMANYCIARGASPVAVAVVLLPTLFIIYMGVLARPNMCSVPLTLAFYCLLHRYRAHGRFRELLWLPALMALWVNIHGGFLLAFLLIGVFLLEACLYPSRPTDPAMGKVIGNFIDRYRNDTHFRGSIALPLLICVWLLYNVGWIVFLPAGGLTLLLGCASGTSRQSKATGLALIAALCLAATLLNPYGFAVYYGAYETLTTSFAKYIMEWKPVQIGHNIPFTVWLALVLCIGSFTDRSIAFADRQLAVVLIVLSLSSLRHSLISALLLMPYLSLRLTALLQATRFAARLKRQEAVFIADMQQPSLRIITACMVLIALVLLSTPWLRGQGFIAPAQFIKERYPVQEAQYILDHYPAKRFLNHYDIGGYLVYLWRGRQKVFVDGRASSLYSEDLLKDYAEFMDNTGFSLRSQSIASFYRIDGLIMPNDARNAAGFQTNPAWKIVYRGPVATIYLATEKGR